jgi:hypothetical protein
MPPALDLSYPNILSLFGPHLKSGQTESRSFLSWFLEHYYRLDEESAQDTVCDGPDDKGIDGVYVNHDLERIDVFQSKLYQNSSKTLGDPPLKEFAGTLDQLRDSGGVQRIADETRNHELRGLLETERVAVLVADGYEVRGSFITNIQQDPSAMLYLQSRQDVQVYDADYLNTNWIPPGQSTSVDGSMTFKLDGLGHIVYRTPEAEVFIASLLASELVEMTGLESQELFAWNVRQSLGKTKVNKSIALSVKEQAEHKNFLLYHNGLTILAEEASVDDDVLTINRYTVVNGCQSLSTLYENRNEVSSELRLLARVIKLGPQSELAERITHHSNNQNSISARDLQSNSVIQRRLQQEFVSVFAGEIGYEIKRGESSGANTVISNDYAGKLLLAFDLEQPWSCHQSYKLFDELHSAIFGRPEANARRIAVLHAMSTAVGKALDELSDRLVATYNLTPYFMLYLLKDVLRSDEIGSTFIGDPREALEALGIDGIAAMVKPVVDDLVVDFDAEISDRSEEAEVGLDYKRELKSPTAVKRLRSSIIPSYAKALRRGRATSFAEEYRTALNV